MVLEISIIVLVLSILGTVFYFLNRKRKWAKKFYPVTDIGDLLDDYDFYMLNELLAYKGNAYDPIIDKTACELAMAHSKYMLVQGKASHDNAGERRTYLLERGAKRVNEIVGIDKDLTRIFKKFLNSYKHKRAIDKAYNCIGIDVSINQYNTYAVTILFLDINPM